MHQRHELIAQSFGGRVVTIDGEQSSDDVAEALIAAIEALIAPKLIAVATDTKRYSDQIVMY